MKHLFLVLLATACFQLFAEEANEPTDAGGDGKTITSDMQLYLGGGISSNSQHDYDDAFGYQVFAGIPLQVKDLQDEFSISAEVGYMDSGKFENTECIRVNRLVSPRGFLCADFEDQREGLWGGALGEYAFSDQISGLARIGLDLGDDDGLMVGFGAKLVFDQLIHARLEYVIRDETDSVQVNLVFTPK